jgi:hypothetical protein
VEKTEQLETMRGNSATALNTMETGKSDSEKKEIFHRVENDHLMEAGQPEETIEEVPEEDVASRESLPRFPDDKAFAERLVAGDEKAWREHFKEWKRKSEIYISKKYPGVFNGSDTENVLQSLEERLLRRGKEPPHTDKYYLAIYKGNISLTKWIEYQLNYAIQDMLRDKTRKYLSEAIDIEKINDEEQSCDKQANKKQVRDEGDLDDYLQTIESKMPQCLIDLPDHQRWVYLLRYYDDFGFPESEIELLARKTGRKAAEISRLIDTLLESDVSRKRMKSVEINELINKYRGNIQFLSFEEHRLEKQIIGGIMGGTDRMKVRERLREISENKARAQEFLQKKLEERGDPAVETSYEVIGKILAVEKESTLRGHLLKARKGLAIALDLLERNTDF